MHIFHQPQEAKYWAEDKQGAKRVGQIESYYGTSTMDIGDFMLIYVDNSDKRIKAGVYAIAVIVSKPYDDCKDDKGTIKWVDTVIIKFKREPIIDSKELKKYTGSFRGPHKIAEKYYDELLEIINR